MSRSYDEDRGALGKIPRQWLEGTVQKASEKGGATARKSLWFKDLFGVTYQVTGGPALEMLRKEAVGQHVFLWARLFTNEHGEKCLKVSQFEKAANTLPAGSSQPPKEVKEKPSSVAAPAGPPVPAEQPAVAASLPTTAPAQSTTASAPATAATTGK